MRARLPSVERMPRRLGLDFIDLDWYIEGRYHQSVGQIFAERGEDGFRQLERNMLHEVGEFYDVVISVGGGTPCFFDNMAYMNTQGQTVYLDVSIDVLFRRLKIAKAKRPLLKDKTDEELRAFIITALENRAPFYEQAQYRFDGSRLESHWQIVNSIEELSKLLSLPSKD